MSNDSRFGRRNTPALSRSSQARTRPNPVLGGSQNPRPPDEIAMPEETSKTTALLYAGAGAALLFSTVLFGLIGLPMLSGLLASNVPVQLTPADVAALPPGQTGNVAPVSAPQASGETPSDTQSDPASR